MKDLKLGNSIKHKITEEEGIIVAFLEGVTGSFLEYMTKEGKIFRVNPVFAEFVDDNPAGFELDDSEEEAEVIDE